ncbi:MAG: DNA polymerase [bacterium]
MSVSGTSSLFSEDDLQPVVCKPDLQGVFSKIEMPLVPVLMHMEMRGLIIDEGKLEVIAKEVAGILSTLEKNIYELAGQEFNINSSQQLADVLYTKLFLKATKKTKTGYSTDAGTLEKLKDQHPIISLLLEYRHYDKLLSTYILPLPTLINKSTGRVHTSFNQSVASTGRLSSSNPNFQNIPIRTEMGQRIRQAFVAAPGYTLLSFDYSQIELRLMAFLSQDAKMLDDFAHDRDIHAATAQRIFHLPTLDAVTSDQRRIAKAINFATMYGAGPRTLGENAGINFNDAKLFLQEYFAYYPAVKGYATGLKELAHKNGYATTLFGRVLHLPDISSSLPQMRAAAERVAVNMPLQGTAADIMKLAMIAVHAFVETLVPDVYIILQVHDELVLEVREEKVGEIALKVRELMEKVEGVAVRLKVDGKVGKTWGEMVELV